MKRKEKRPDLAERVAKEIADGLFTNGIGEEANSLILNVKGKDGGGWCKQAVIDFVAEQLRKAGVKGK